MLLYMTSALLRQLWLRQRPVWGGGHSLCGFNRNRDFFLNMLFSVTYKSAHTVNKSYLSTQNLQLLCVYRTIWLCILCADVCPPPHPPSLADQDNLRVLISEVIFSERWLITMLHSSSQTGSTNNILSDLYVVTLLFNSYFTIRGNKHLFSVVTVAT